MHFNDKRFTKFFKLLKKTLKKIDEEMMLARFARFGAKMIKLFVKLQK